MDEVVLEFRPEYIQDIIRAPSILYGEKPRDIDTAWDELTLAYQNQKETDEEKDLATQGLKLIRTEMEKGS